MVSEVLATITKYAFSSLIDTLMDSCALGAPDRGKERLFVIGTEQGILYSKLNPYSPGGGRNGEWYTDIKAVVMEIHPKNADEAIMEVKKKILEDLLHAYGLVHGRIVSGLTQVNDIWFVQDDVFGNIIDALAGF